MKTSLSPTSAALVLAMGLTTPGCGANSDAALGHEEAYNPQIAPPAARAGAIVGVPGCPLFPPDNAWNRDVSADPVDPGSDAMIAAMNGGSRFLHPDFGSDPSYGIPWITVPGGQARVPMSFTWDDESDPGPYPFPAGAPVEAGGDRHVIVVDRDNCRLYETFNSYYEGPGWRADAGARFDLRSNALRPLGWTSADAAGLPIFAGLARRDEAAAGEIRHALRFTVRRTRRAYVLPATHFASSRTDEDLPPMGARVRLKASYDLSRFSGHARVILTALRRYGMFVADNGSDWFISGETNRAWDDDDLRQLKSVPGSAFEVVRLGTVYTR